MSLTTILVYLCMGAVIFLPIIGIVAIFIPLLVTRFRSARLLHSGVTAPALVNSVKVGLATSSGSSGRHSREDMRWRVEFDVTVQPANDAPFHASFMSLLVESDTEQAPHEKKIWVRYDPNDHSKVAFEETDSSRTQRIAGEFYVQTVPAYWEMDAKYHAPLRLNGKRSEAVVIQREKIIDASSTPGGPFLYRFWLDVIPDTGSPFRAETQLMINDEAKYSVGEKINVCLDPNGLSFVAIENF